MTEPVKMDSEDFFADPEIAPPVASPDDTIRDISFEDVRRVEMLSANDSAVRTSENYVVPTWNRPSSPGVAYRLTWLMTLTAALLSSTWVVPYTIEHVEYARERGRQKAQVDVATVALKDDRTPLKELSKAYQLVSQRVSPSVVHINVSEDESEAKSENREDFGFQRRKTDGQGSGVIMDSNGFILTNRHVVHATRNIEAFLSDGRRVPAKILGEDHLTDLAVLKINADHLVAAEWGDSESMEVGALVWAVGSPFGLERSITFGILSAKHRSGHAGTLFQDLMQTDAAVNPGNSGGPLVDVMGRVIGINTAIVGPSYQGISFSIPSDVARDVFQRLKKEGRVNRGWLGVELERIPPDQLTRWKLTVDSGAYVKRLANSRNDVQSPARIAGIQSGDIIVRWNEQQVDSPATLIGLIGKTEVGTTSIVKLLRDGLEKTLEVKVVTRPDDVN